jgi:hypothetical protein
VGHLLAPVRSRVTGRRGMTPGYLIVGTKRGGSTSIAHWVEKHPQVAPCRLTKGTHYFDVNFQRGWQWYLSCFPQQHNGIRITGEASPYYMFHPLSVERIARALPDVRIIVSLREPVARAWSHHQYERQQGFEDRSFAEAVALEGQRLRGEEDLLRANPRYESYAHRHYTYVQRGHYAEQLERLYEHFPREQVLVVRSESMFAEPQRELARVWAHLGLDPVRLDGLDRYKATHTPMDIPPELHQHLIDHYRPWNERLQQLLGADFNWHDQPTQRTGHGDR